MNTTTIPDSQMHVNITKERYIQFLEAENALYRIQSKLSGMAIKTETPTPTGQPYVPPFGMQNCNLNAITRRIHATGISTKQWSKDNGFRDSAVRSVICGNMQSKSITDALTRDGFMEAAPCS